MLGLNELKIFGKNAGDMVVRNSPSILTALGVGGLFTTVFMAVRVTPKAVKLIEEEEYTRKKDAFVESFPFEPVTKMDIVKMTWKLYAPAVAMGLGTAICIVGANSISMRRYAALGGLYGLAEASLKEYQEKVVGTLGEKKEAAMRSDILQDKLDANPLSGNTIIMTGKKGNTLCFDTLSGRYFKSDIETIRKIQNDFNLQILNGSNYATLNEWYDELGLDHTKLGDKLSWSLDYMLNLVFDTKLSDDGEPCLVLDYRVVPQKNY